MIARILDLLLRMASHRWPESLREEAEREWRAELAEIRSEAGVAAPLRTVRALSFATSLARSRVGETGETWTDRATMAFRASRPFLLLLAMPLLAYLGLSVIGSIAGFPRIFFPTSASPPNGPVDTAISVVCLLAAIALGGLIGWRLGGSLPLIVTKDRSLGLAAAVLAVPLSMGAGALITFQFGLTTPESNPVEISRPGTVVVLALVFWSAGLGVVGWLTGRRVLAGHGRGGALWAAAAGLVLVWIAVTAVIAQAATRLGASIVSAPLWFPVQLVPGVRDQFFGIGPQNLPFAPGAASFINWLYNTGDIPSILLICTTFALAYTLRHARQPIATALRSRSLIPPLAATVQMPALSTVAWVLTACGALIWADALTLPIRYAENIEAAAGDAPSTVHLWIQDLRQLAILLVGLGLLVALRHRRAALPVAALAAGGLFAADLIIDSKNLEGLVAFLFALAIAAALVLTALGASTLAGPASQGQAANSRTFTRIAVTAGFAAPAAMLNISSAPITVIPADLTAGTIGVAVALAALAGTCALLARPAAVTAKTAALAALPAVLLTSALAVQLSTSGVVAYMAALSTPLAAYFFGLARWSRRPDVPILRVVIRRIGFIVLILLATPLLSMLAIQLSTQISPFLMKAAGYSYGADGVPYALGATVVGSILGILATVRFRPFALRRTKPIPLTGTETA